VSSSLFEVRDRSYRQYCGVARALDLVGERWGLLVVRELVLGPKRFTDLLRGLPGVSTNVLSTRLRQLERAGVVERRLLPPPAASTVYELTTYGRELEPILFALGRWGARSLGSRDEDQTLRSHWLAVALKAFFHPRAAVGVAAVYELLLHDGPFRIDVRDGAVEVSPGRAEDAVLTLEADDDALVALLSAGVASDEIRVEQGDPAELQRFVELFRFAEPAAA
jgi:DNA-binding HxlR family transcriptional regulator